MADNNGGPWGGGGSGGNRGNKGNGGGNDRGPDGPQIPEIDELMRKGQEQLRVLMGGKGSGGTGGGSGTGGGRRGHPAQHLRPGWAGRCWYVALRILLYGQARGAIC